MREKKREPINKHTFLELPVHNESTPYKSFTLRTRIKWRKISFYVNNLFFVFSKSTILNVIKFRKKFFYDANNDYSFR